MRLSRGQPQNEQSHVVVLRRSGCEGVSFAEEMLENRPHGLEADALRGFQHPVFTPLFVIGGHGFADAVGVAGVLVMIPDLLTPPLTTSVFLLLSK